MKNLLIAISLLSSLNVLAHDMSKSETYKTAYTNLTDGSDKYIGGCSTHQDYEGKWFMVTRTIIEYFEPNYDAPEADIQKRISKLEPELVQATLKHLNSDSFAHIDDLTVEKIVSTKFQNTDLFRLNIGVGGGNGMYLIFNRVKANASIQYEILSDIMDGDVQFCDSKIWLTK